MMYAPRALRHFSVAAMEGRAERPANGDQAGLRPVRVSPPPLNVHPIRPRHTVRLWLPTTVLFVLLAPFALLLAPLLYLAPQPYCVRPFATAVSIGQLLLSLSGTVVDVDTPDALVRIRIF